MVFSKFHSTVIGCGDDILLPEDQGSRLRSRVGGGDWQNANVAACDAMDYCLVTRVVTMFPQGIGRKVALGDSGCSEKRSNLRPIGPCLVTTDELQDPSNLRVRMHLNEEVVQDSTTSQLIFDIGL